MKVGMKPGLEILRTAVLAAAALALLSAPASAAHGKAGLWHITVTVSGPGMPAMPAAARAQMKARGVNMPSGHTISAQHCMTAQEVASDRFPFNEPAQQDCKMINLKTVGHTFSGDLVCSGQMTGQGHIAITYETDEHYSGKMAFSGSASSRPLQMNYRYEGRWLKADCGNVHD
ncbi:MAG: DUF3617 family protein [Alphaproteobacteria bacterium]|nr:DUF3617 family protein [Alphaproteobacteria bacterium]MDE2012682.1 DUF3617 domain-containing protein [Alphaproteobacteria bacterium]MDE2072006.1 DUF3617 domain-containing protein [Alphaproteobacteria bacterium]MDE2353007.1 DUF3617 domain-containing protein [Alphaproteobacteria bacterium]